MTLEDEKRFITLRNALWGVGILVAVGLIGGALQFYRSENTTSSLFSRINVIQGEISQIENSLTVFASGDTPVVLIGGSVDLETNSKWQSDTTVPGGYYASGEGPIGAISIRDRNSGEFTKVKTNGESWVVTVVSNQDNAITISQDANDSKIHITPVSGTLTVSTTAPTKLHYHKRGMQCGGGGEACDSLETVSITVNQIPLGVFNCIDGPPSHPGNSGHCRVAFVEK